MVVCYCHSSLKAVEWVLPPPALGDRVECLFDDGFSISEGNGMSRLLNSSQFNYYCITASQNIQEHESDRAEHGH